MAKSKWTKEHMDALFREYLGDDADDSVQARKKRRILRAAHELFLTQGYRKTSIDDVARKAEVAKGTVYLYFENKGALLMHAIALEKKVMLKRLAPLLAGEIPKRDRLKHYLEIVLTSARDLPLSARLLTGDKELFAALEDIGSTELLERRSEGADWMMELIEDAAPGALDDEERRARAETLIGVGFCSGMLLDERVRGGRSLDEFASTLADMLVHGISGKRRGRR